eukprot:CAMPEP_0201490758 /NCGR_PEP_ID=MMETSP0151_2-20130828/27316_1 /ASSEMBLY_ACC=CAM_ASM_000257 /TAXON_ID=200890 /ORGANISM="Paramoeba atlantica, Strain 621/1 / CCAP 1560/9" /LENGTH=51 /DNA_ID=CAMNT_0047876829 /DNA_START=137 /DNA_END=289 /DNA_ORIENTATION=-
MFLGEKKAQRVCKICYLDNSVNIELVDEGGDSSEGSIGGESEGEEVEGEGE